jgi:hypothetical protein
MAGKKQNLLKKAHSRFFRRLKTGWSPRKNLEKSIRRAHKASLAMGAGFGLAPRPVLGLIGYESVV